MQWYKNLKIQHKLNGGFGLILICFLGMALGLAAINRLPIIVSKALLGNGNMCIDIAHVAMAVDAYQINQDRAAALKAIDDAVANYENNYTAVSNVLFTEENISKFKENGEKNRAYFDKARAFVNGTGNTSWAETRAFYAETTKMLDETRTTEPPKIYAKLTKLKDTMLLISLLIVAAGFALSLKLSRMIARGLNEGVDFAKEIADGDLTAKLEIEQRDEIGRLAKTMRDMAGKLNYVVNQIRYNADEVSSGSSEIKSSSEHLAQSATEQAASVEEIAATIEEMTSSIKAAAASAEDGRRKAIGAIGLVNENVTRSREMAHAMDAITAAAGQIREITATVNEVAFQTNLLALNAAVEAARAGEHGKGFAVVAEEVRSLAQRSANASHEIKQLIEATVSKVEAGSAVVSEVVQAMETINVTTQDLSQSMEEIAAASAEQAAGVDELNRAIAQVDNSTQSNAAIVEELAGSANVMHGSATAMLEMVSTFKTTA